MEKHSSGHFCHLICQLLYVCGFVLWLCRERSQRTEDCLMTYLPLYSVVDIWYTKRSCVWASGVIQVVEHLPSKDEALGSNPTAPKTKKRKHVSEWRGFLLGS
jgi:hypothetical protein